MTRRKRAVVILEVLIVFIGVQRQPFTPSSKPGQPDIRPQFKTHDATKLIVLKNAKEEFVLNLMMSSQLMSPKDEGISKYISI